MKLSLSRRSVGWVSIGMLIGIAFTGISVSSFQATSTSEYCMSCHEMQIVGEQGWMKSSHYNNAKGVVAGCSDCHIPPGLIPYTTTKIRDGSKDLFVHYLGEADPYKMDWSALGKLARFHIKDSSCLRCHSNLLPTGLSIKGIIAHVEYGREDNVKKCLDCHKEEFHPKFKEYLFGKSTLAKKGTGHE